MQRSSPSIGTLASALAKAQERTRSTRRSHWSATLRAGDGPKGTEQTFRYAPLSSGLDIVRKIWASTRLPLSRRRPSTRRPGLSASRRCWRTLLGNGCLGLAGLRIDETATPHRMGAALTYARRYALFTLVGIAGEDDLDAPDVATPTNQTSGRNMPSGTGSCSCLNGGHGIAAGRAGDPKAAKPVLALEASAELRDRLLVELNDLGSPDAAAAWAHRSLGEKNKLTAPDAQRVEEAFQGKLGTFVVPPPADDPQTAPERPAAARRSPRERNDAKRRTRRGSKLIDKSLLTLPEPRRIRDREHVKSVAKRPCLICGRQPSDAHHLRFAQSRALGRKVSDEFTVPLCRGHHRDVHRCGDEAAWWKSAGVDPVVVARALWLETHPLPNGEEDIDNDQNSAKRDHKVGQKGANYKTKPICEDRAQ